MKVVLFCGGQGMRLREYSENVPKPMVPIGYRPVMWHLMKYYAHYGHKDFILCLGHKADYIKKYFLEYEESLSNDFVLRKGGKDLTMLSTDIDSWSITFVDTGVDANIGQRLMAVREHLAGEDEFFANYSDNLTDLPLQLMVDDFRRQKKVASFVTVPPSHSFHTVAAGADGSITDIVPVRDSGMRLNGGYFVFRKEIFDYMRDGEELVLAPFQRLIKERQLIGYQHDGFWACMDTFKEKQALDDLWSKGAAPWEVWKPKRLKAAGGGSAVDVAGGTCKAVDGAAAVRGV
jgi:glucose-1-phosphate cytidylyltransferase